MTFATMKNIFLIALLAVGAVSSQTPSTVTFDNNRRLLFDTDGNQIDA